MSVDVNRSEFLCPLCKSLSNTLIAHVPPPAHASSLHRLPPAVGDEMFVQDSDVTVDGEVDLVERLATADGLAGWVLLEEHGGVGVGRVRREVATGSSPMDVDGGRWGADGRGKRMNKIRVRCCTRPALLFSFRKGGGGLKVKNSVTLRDIDFTRYI